MGLSWLKKYINYDTPITQNDWNQTLVTKINEISAQIYMSILIGATDIMVSNSDCAELIKQFEYFNSKTNVIGTRFQFIEMTAKHLGWEIEWKGEGVDEKGYDKKSGKLLVEVDLKYFRPAEVDRLIGDSSKAKDMLGWEAKIDLDELIERMVNHDL